MLGYSPGCIKKNKVFIPTSYRLRSEQSVKSPPSLPWWFLVSYYRPQWWISFFERSTKLFPSLVSLWPIFADWGITFIPIQWWCYFSLLGASRVVDWLYISCWGKQRVNYAFCCYVLYYVALCERLYKQTDICSIIYRLSPCTHNAVLPLGSTQSNRQYAYACNIDPCAYPLPLPFITIEDQCEYKTWRRLENVVIFSAPPPPPAGLPEIPVPKLLLARSQWREKRRKL